MRIKLIIENGIIVGYQIDYGGTNRTIMFYKSIGGQYA